MSQLILDDQLNVRFLVPRIQKWASVQRLQDLRPEEHILDDRVPEILRTLHSPTFVTIDEDYWNRKLCNPGYLYFALADEEQKIIPVLLRAVLRLSPFRSRASRMGKVVRVSKKGVAFWDFQGGGLHLLPWKESTRKKK
jgi:hypothetical protein